MFSCWQAAALGLLVCVLAVGPAAADEAADMIRRALRAAPSRAEAAGRMVKLARGLGDAPAVQKRLYEKAYECGVSAPAGHASALAALDLLDGIAPDEAAKWDDKRLEVYRRGYSQGDRAARLISAHRYVEMIRVRAGRFGKDRKWSDAVKLYRQASSVVRTFQLPQSAAVNESLRDANNWILAGSRVAGLKAAVERNPNDTMSRKRLVEMYLIDLDAPAEAAKYVGKGLDATLRKNLAMAARQVFELSDADFLTQASWYRSLAAKTPARMAKARLLTRAGAGLKMFLSVYGKDDAQRTRITKMLGEVEAEIARLRSARRPPGRPLTLRLGNGVTMKLINIPAGLFMMGSPKTERGREAHEGPQHEVTISKPFYMGMTEVTQAQYAAVMGKNPSTSKGARKPVTDVHWNDTAAFCKALSKKTRRNVRLPTEAQWEYACRAGTTTGYYFGNADKHLGDYAWYKGNSGEKTHPVARKKPNAWGLYDMGGNVWEWCRDWYGGGYHAKTTVVDPQGPAIGKDHVTRGGGMRAEGGTRKFRSAQRGHFNGVGSQDGFRVVVVSR